MTEQAREEVRRRPLVASLRLRWRGLAIAGVTAIGGALALVALHRPAGTDSRYSVVEQEVAPPATQANPLMTELIRCRTLPPQADDPTCRAAWEENRRRFFGESRATRVPGEPLPVFAPIRTSGSVPAAKER